MKKITPIVKTIADAHIEARKTGVWTGGKVNSKREAVSEMYAGKTFEHVMYAIERRYCSITSTLMSNVIGYTSPKYKSDVYRGFKELFFNN